MKKIPRKGWVSLGCLIVSLVLIPVMLYTGYTIVIVTTSALSGFAWGIIYALPSNSKDETQKGQ